MRILFFSAFFKAKGHETYLSDEISKMAETYPELQFIVYTTNSLKNSVTRLRKNILWIQRKNLRNIRVIFQFIKEMSKIFTKFKPNIVHSTYVVESLIMALIGKIFRVPTILHGRGADLNYFVLMYLTSNILARLSCKLNTHILTVSKMMKRDVIRFFNIPEKKITHIYNGVDYELFKLKHPRNFSNVKTFELIHIGRFSPEKRHDLILEVVKDLKDNNFNVHFTSIGFRHTTFRYSPIVDKVKNKVMNVIRKNKLESNVSLEGFVEHDNIPSYLEKAHLYLQPSKSEGLPNSVLEAMCMELPVVMTKAGGMLELNTKPGTILVEKNSRKQLYDAIVTFFNNPERMLEGGKKNREFVLRNFTWDKHIEKLYKIYSKYSKK